MKEVKIKVSPSNEELIENFEQEFSSEYSYSLSGLGSDKSILIRKSKFMGAQISKSENGFSIQALMPLSFLGWISSLILNIYASGAMVMWMSPYRKFEKRVALFLKNKYG